MTNPLLIQRSRDERVERVYDALRALSRDAYAYLEVEGARPGPEAERYRTVMDTIENVLELVGHSRWEAPRLPITRSNINAADMALRLDADVSAASDDTLAALRSFCYALEATLGNSLRRRTAVLEAIPERVRTAQTAGYGRLFNFLGWEDAVAEEVATVLQGLSARGSTEFERRREVAREEAKRKAAAQWEAERAEKAGAL